MMFDEEVPTHVVSAHWVNGGVELMVQTEDSVFLISSDDGTRRIIASNIHPNEVIGIGVAGKSWWLAYRDQPHPMFLREAQSPFALIGLGDEKVRQMVVSPTGEHAAVETENAGIVVLELESGDEVFRFRIEVDGEAAEFFPVPEVERIEWAPDGRQFFVQTGTPIYELYLVDLAEGRPHRVTSGSIWRPKFSDNAKLTLHEGSGTGTLEAQGKVYKMSRDDLCDLWAMAEQLIRSDRLVDMLFTFTGGTWVLIREDWQVMHEQLRAYSETRRGAFIKTQAPPAGAPSYGFQDGFLEELFAR